MRLYVNGELAGSRPSALHFTFASNPPVSRLMVGATPSGWNEYDDAMDELVHYTQVG
jgi:hypothetical protein